MPGRLKTTAWLLMVLMLFACCGLSAQTGAWSPVGPASVNTTTYGLISGRVTSIAIDPDDSSGNTVYVGTTGGGVWKSTNAAGPASAVSFAPLTDTLSVFSANEGSSAIASLSIGALAVQPGSTGVLLAGTGDPNGAADSYYGSGLLRSVDQGATWSLIQLASRGTSTATFVGEAFAGFAWSTVSPQVVVAAVASSAEAATVHESKFPGVRGLFVSTDAGVTWSVATVQDGTALVQGPSSDYSSYRGNTVTSVVWNPVRRKFYAAIQWHGYYESADGATWTRLSQQPGTGLTLQTCPTRTGLGGLTTCPMARGALAVQPVSGDLFALTVDGANRDQGLWQDVCAKSGTDCATNVSWATRIDASPMETAGVVAAGSYNLVLAAVPAATASSGSDTLLFAGSSDLYRCGLAGGCSLRNLTNATNSCATPAGVAPFQHAMAWQGNPADSARPTMFFGNDGGLWRSLDGANEQGTTCSSDDARHFDNLNGGIGSLAEVTAFASHPSDANTLLVALGANGSAVSTMASQAAAASPWTQLSSKPSGTVAIDQASGNTWLVQSGNGVALHTCGSNACTQQAFNAAATIGLTQVGGDASLADPPMLFDPALGSNVIVGTCRVWRGPSSGSGWTAANVISHVLAGPLEPACNSFDAYIRSLAAGGAAVQGSSVQNSGSPVLYAGLAGVNDGAGSFAGHIYTTRSANTASSTTLWTDLTGNPVSNDLQDGFNQSSFDISSIATDPSDATGLTVYATIMGFDVPHLYRSVNGGDTWVAISANLPNAPANSVVVDPRDARIVYVAMDNGVYFTQDVTSCVPASGGGPKNCWNLLGASLPNAPVLSLAISHGLTLPGATTQGVLRAGTYGRGIWQIPLPAVSAPALPAISLSASYLTFGVQTPGTTSATQTLTISNTGGSVLNVAGTTISAGFAAAGNCAGAALAAGQSCAIQVSFTPASSDLATGTLTVTSNSNGVAGTQTVVPLNGNVPAGFVAVLQPTSMDFGQQLVGTTSAVKNVTISNLGNATGGLAGVTVSGDFRITFNSCTTSLTPDTSCTVSVVFAPTARGPLSGLLRFTDDAGVQAVTLAGTGAASATDTLSPLALDFAAQQANTSSALQTVTLSNTGDAVLTVVAANILAGDFTVVNGCGASVAAHSTCSIGVGFAPAGVGEQTGVLQVSDVFRVQTIALHGTGIAGPGVSLLPLMLNFPITGVNETSAGQTLTFTNNSGVALVLSDIAITGDFAMVAGSNTCIAGQTIAASSACSMRIAFLPTVAGVRIGSVAVSSNGPTRTTQLLGTGIDFALQADGPTTFSIHSGDNAVFTLLLRPAVAERVPVTFACAGVPPNATCNVRAQYTELSATGTVVATVLTGTTASTSATLRGVVALLLMAAPLGLRRTRRAMLLFALASAMLFFTDGCGKGRAIPDAGDGSGNGSGTANPVTPSGTYVITVSATTAGITRSVPLTLVVQ